MIVNRKTCAPLIKTHDATRCVGRPCVLHSPSHHALHQYPLDWEPVRGMRRVCDHQVYHRDPDEVEFRVEILGDRREALQCDCTCSCCISNVRFDPAWTVLDSFPLYKDAAEYADFMSIHVTGWFYDSFTGQLWLRKGYIIETETRQVV
jgi:hypothetical protein